MKKRKQYIAPEMTGIFMGDLLQGFQDNPTSTHKHADAKKHSGWDNEEAYEDPWSAVGSHTNAGSDFETPVSRNPWED